jgi:hypothetical protein
MCFTRLKAPRAAPHGVLGAAKFVVDANQQRQRRSVDLCLDASNKKDPGGNRERGCFELCSGALPMTRPAPSVLALPVPQPAAS